MRTAPYRIETQRLVLRCWQPGDAAVLKQAIDSSLDHLRRWLPWAWEEPQPLDEKIELLRRFRADFDRDGDYVYGVWDRAESEVLGGAGLHRRVGDNALEIGYWTRADRTRQGIAREAAGVLTRVGLTVCGADRMEIRVEPDNHASAAIPAFLGYRREAVLRRRLTWPDTTPRDAVVSSLFAGEAGAVLDRLPQATLLDAAGRTIEI